MYSASEKNQMPKTYYSRFELLVRSITYTIISTITIVIESIIVMCCFLLPLRWRYQLIRFFLLCNLSLLKFLCHIDYVVEGLENIPKDRVGVVMSKHQSTWETFYLATIFPDMAIITKRELMWLPFFGWGLAASQPISINRKDKVSAMQQLITKGTKFLAEKRWIVVFPEGTRTPYGTAGHYRIGGARLAVAAKTFIIPVAHNAGRLWPRRNIIRYPGMVRVVIGVPIESTGRTPEEMLVLTKDWIETTMERIK